MLNIEYKASTENDMADMVQSLLMVRSTAFMASKFVETRTELHEGGYNDLLIAFDTISMLVEPAIKHITNEMMSKPKKKYITHRLAVRKGAGKW